MKTQTKSSLDNFRGFSPASFCQRSRRTIGGLIVLLAGMHWSGSVHAAQIVWTNAAGGNWSAAANWSPNQVPGSTDDAVISAGGAYTVTLDASPALESLTLGGASGQQTLSTAGYTLSWNSSSVVASNGVLAFSGGYLEGGGLLTINGQLQWTAGEIYHGCLLTVATNGVLVLAGADGYPYYLEGIITNAGTLQLASGDLNIYNCSAAAELINLPGGLVELTADVSIGIGCSGEFVNQGALVKSGGSGTSTIQAVFTNSGTVEADTGIVSIAGGATLNGGSLFIGAGQTALSASTATLNGGLTSSNLVLAGANLAGSGVLSGVLTWAAGEMTGGAILTVATNGVLVLAGANGDPYYVEGFITNAGTLQLVSGDLNLYSCNGSAELINLPGAVVDMRADVSIGTGCSGAFVNQGTLVKSGGAGTSTIQPAFINSGTVEANTGIISIAGSAALNGGSLFIGTGQTALSASTATLNGGLTSSNLVLAGANLAGSGVLSGILTWTAGEMAGGAILTVATNGVLVLAGTNGGPYYAEGIITNAGTLQLVSGDLNLYSCNGSAELINLPGAVVDMRADVSIGTGCSGAFVNQGTLVKSGGAGTSAIQAMFTNNGTLDVQTGTVSLTNNGQGNGVFLPEAGATLIFAGTYEVDGALTGAGTILLNGGTFTLNGNINGANVVLNGANLLASNTVINGALTWSNGYINPGSVLTVATSGLLALTGGNGHGFYGILTNAGTIQLLNGGGSLVLSGSCVGGIGQLWNLPGALVDVQGDSSISGYCGTTELVLNQGMVRKSGGTGTTTVSASFTNSGTVQVNSGMVSFGSAFLQSAGQTLLNGGNFSFSQMAQLCGGALTGAGTITGSVSNNAAIGTGASPGWLAISGNYTEGPNAHLAIKLGGAPSGANCDQLSIGGNASLAGSLGISYWNGFTPSVSNVFTVLACSVRSGVFSAVTTPGNGLDAVYTATNVLVLPYAAPPTAQLTLPAQALAGHTFAVAGSGSYLQGTVTNLALMLGANVLVSAPGNSATVNYSCDFPGGLTFTAVATGNNGVQGQTNATMTIVTLPLLTLDALGVQTNDAFKLLMLGNAGDTYQVQAGANLAVTNWTTLGTMENTNGIWRYYDATATNSPERYYRAKQLP